MLDRNFILPSKEIAERETALRMALLPRIVELFGPHAECIFVSGSLAAGRNHSVHEKSDIDTALVVTPEGAEGLLGTGLFDGGPLAHYVEGFKRGLAKQCTVETHIDGIRIECHFLDRDAYLDGLRQRTESLPRFRSTSTTPSINYGFTFDGSEIETDLPSAKIDDWFVGPFPFYQRQEAKFYPCRLLTGLLATPIILKGEQELTPIIDGLWSWMAEELRAAGGDESRLETFSVLKALPGNWKFSPETIDAITQRTKAALLQAR